MVVSHHLGVGTQTLEEQLVLLTSEPSLQPQELYFLKTRAYLAVV